MDSVWCFCHGTGEVYATQWEQIFWCYTRSATYAPLSLFAACCTDHDPNNCLSILNPSVHGDVQLQQWLGTQEGKLKLGDFNRAEVMDYDPVRGKYCKYNNGDCYGNVSLEKGNKQCP
jgi:hypothetical protein